MAPASRSEKLAHAIGGLAYDLAVLKANEILLERRLRGDSAINAFRDESTDIQKQIESAWRASRERMAVRFKDEQKARPNLAQPFHRVRDDLRRLLDSFPTTEAVKPIAAEQSANGGGDGARAAVIAPILKKKGWSILDWAKNSAVDFHTANDFLKDKTNAYRSTRKKLAESLGVSVEDLPK